MKFVRSQKENLDRYEIGGKGYNLRLLYEKGFKVPESYFVVTDAFDFFLDENDLREEISSSLSRAKLHDVQSIETASEEISGFILSAKIPKQISDELFVAFSALDSDSVAVRSSACVEDSARAAFAGQLSSFLCIKKDGLEEHIKKCWASLYTPRAIAYCLRADISLLDEKMSVVLQPMIYSEKSGVAFSVHPVTGMKNHLCIESVYGLGEAIVSGEITPDKYIVDKNKRKIFEKDINPQGALMAVGENGILWKSVRGEKAQEQKISDDEILEVADMTVRLEKEMGYPADIEWAYEGNRLYILQSRPITTLGYTRQKETSRLVDYLKSQKWFFGVRAEQYLLFYSASADGRRKYSETERGMDFTESLLLPRPEGYPIRAFNLHQTKEFHSHSRNDVIKRPAILLEYLEKERHVWKEIQKIESNLEERVSRADLHGARDLFERAMREYEKHGAYFYIIFSLGMQLTEHRSELGEEAARVLHEHDDWRNSVTFDEEKLAAAVQKYFEYALSGGRLAKEVPNVMKYMTVREISKLMQNKMSLIEAENLIDERRRYGFVFLSLRDYPDIEVLSDKGDAREITDYFTRLQNDQTIAKSADNFLRGSSVLQTGEDVEGEVVVALTLSELKSAGKMDGRILVTVQTRPHFIPYLSGVKALITDEGGITCHAAIIAREYKIPAVVGTHLATKKLKTGDRVRINTQTGIVTF